MLQRTRQSQCIFCQICASLKHHRSYASTSTYQTSRTQKEDTSLKKTTSQKLPARHHDAALRLQLRRHDALKSPKDTIPTQERQRELAAERRAEKEQTYQDKRSKIFSALKSVRAHFARTRMSRSSSISQLKGLDPTGTLWPQFESMIKRALESPSPMILEAGLIGTLMAIEKHDSIQFNMQREIQFAFMDYVLDRRQTSERKNETQLDMRYPTEWYAQARQIQRVIHLHVGPTNSGKTYNALKRLEQAKDGFYAGPLRLLAHEVYSRFNNRNIACNLVTGDDVRLDNSGGVKLYASTVEMVDSSKTSKVGVIDEIQMIGDNARGWAWTRALLAAKVEELHLCGEARVVPLIREVVASMGDTLHIHQYERLNPLKVMSRSLKGNLKNLRKGDCVVSFSVVNIHGLKRQIELETGRRCAIVYGSLPPETRAQQAALFNDPENDYDYLVASDAIGMGLNLSIKRIVFETTSKFDGITRRRLSIPQLKQIAGRAGRYRTSQDDKKHSKDGSTSLSTSAGRTQDDNKNIGLVTCLDEADLPVLQHALSTDGPPLKAAGVLPPGEFYEELASSLPEGVPFEYILRRMCNTVSTNARFEMCEINSQMKIARLIDDVQGLSIEDRLTFCASPSSFTSGPSKTSMQKVVFALAKAVEAQKGITVADVPEVPLEVLDEPMSADKAYLQSLETLHKSLILYLWLSYRFPRVLREQDMAIRAKEICEEKINTTLTHFSANPKLVQRLAYMKKSSEMLRDQAREKGLVVDMPLIMNPDQTVEEIESTDVGEQIDHEHFAKTSLEEKIEVQGELDIGEEGQVQELASQVETHDQENLDAFDGQDEPQRAGVSG